MRKKTLFIVTGLLLLGVSLFAQPERIGVGLAFSTKKRFNNSDTGNPGVNLATWIRLDRKKTMYLVPSVSVFNPLTMNHTSFLATNYMVQADLDFHYMAYHEKTLKLVALAGLNYTGIISRNEMVISVPLPPVDSTLQGFGPNIGAALEMRMGSMWDFIVTGKYKFTGLKFNDPALEQGLLSAPLSAFVVQIHAVYYFRGRGKGYRY